MKIEATKPAAEENVTSFEKSHPVALRVDSATNQVLRLTETEAAALLYSLEQALKNRQPANT
jgi:hypothetical protein